MNPNRQKLKSHEFMQSEKRSYIDKPIAKTESEGSNFGETRFFRSRRETEKVKGKEKIREIVFFTFKI